MFLKKNDSWTVYKQNPDWRAAANYLTEEGIFSEGASVFTVTPANALIYYLRRSGTERKLGVKIYNRYAFEQAVATSNARISSLIKNRYWKGSFDKVFQRLIKGRRFKLMDIKAFKGLKVYSFRVLTRTD